MVVATLGVWYDVGTNVLLVVGTITTGSLVVLTDGIAGDMVVLVLVGDGEFVVTDWNDVGESVFVPSTGLFVVSYGLLVGCCPPPMSGGCVALGVSNPVGPGTSDNGDDVVGLNSLVGVAVG